MPAPSAVVFDPCVTWPRSGRRPASDQFRRDLHQQAVDRSGRHGRGRQRHSPNRAARTGGRSVRHRASAVIRRYRDLVIENRRIPRTS